MTAAYEAWHGLMYCVGVFVTCNVGGAALRMARDGASGLMRRHASTADASGDGGGRKSHPFDDLPVDEKSLYSDIENAANASVEQEAAVTGTESADGWKPQSFEEIQRELGRADADA